MWEDAGMFVERRVELNFAEESQAAETHTNLSAVRQDGRCLWVAGDETATIERLTAQTDDSGRVTCYDDQLTVRLADLVDLPAGPGEEADIEGLARSNGWLYAVGSHSLKRKRVKDSHSDAKSRRRLATVVREANRHILARLPLAEGPDGRSVPVAKDGLRTAALLGAHGDSLTDLLIGDPHLAPFLAIPSKDNGVDIEGIAALPGDRLYIGFRGPVLRGWAVLMEIQPESHPDDPRRLRLRQLDGGDRYRTHFLDLGGLGIRDLCPYGDDLLILAGPTMSLSGPIRVFRWRGATQVAAADIVHRHEMELLGDLPHGQGVDHAEGIAVIDHLHDAHEENPTLLVVYDSPAPDRLTSTGGIYADVVTFSD